MGKFGFDQEALINQFAEASARGGETLRKAVHEATLKALQGRELTMANVRKVVKGVAEAATTGAARNPLGAEQMEPLLAKALAGMDAALLQAVEANHRALQQLIDHGASLRDNQIRQAMDDIDRMEDMFFTTLRKAIGDASSNPLQGVWSQALEKMQMKGTSTGMQAGKTLEDLSHQAQDGLRASRAVSMKAAKALMDSYAALASGVLIGMSQGLQAGMGAPAADKPAAKAAPRRR